MLGRNKLLELVFSMKMRAVVIAQIIFFLSSVDGKFPDWLITELGVKTKLRTLPGSILELTNGLVSRKFLLKENLFATLDLYSHEKKSSLIRAIQPEAIICLDGVQYNVGGFNTPSMSRAYLNRFNILQS